MKIAVFPGSFDPITLGHQNIVERALPLFDKIIVAIGQNALKNYHFSMEQRISFIQLTFDNNPKMNKEMSDTIETIFIPSIPELSAINSTIIRDILINGGEVNKFVPAILKNKLIK